MVVVFRASPLFIMDKELIPSSNCNAVPGDHMITKASSPAYRAGYDRIFNKSKEASPDAQEQSCQTCEDCQKQTEAEDLCNESTCAAHPHSPNQN